MDKADLQGSPSNTKSDSTPESPIIYRYASKSVYLIDLPHSIKCAQSLRGEDSARQLKSCEPLQHPYPSTEPKRASALKRLEEQSKTLTPGEVYEELIKDGLAQIRAAYNGPWCLPRCVTEGPATDSQQSLNSDRVLSEVGLGESGYEPRIEAGIASGAPSTTLFRPGPDGLNLSNAASLRDQVFRNLHHRPTCLHISAPSSKFLIPPQSSFILSSLSRRAASLLSLALQSARSESSLRPPSEFDLILLDPPWPNRSARRSSSYSQAQAQIDDPFYGISEILPAHLGPGGYLACWITHAAATRRAIDKVFADCEVDLFEEWVWAKITETGEMAIPLGSKWRRGWEMLVIGRKSLDVGECALQVKRRLIVAVPDVHSRKPCLKSLFEELLVPGPNQRVLEVFARHLTSGWCSLGDEVLRFNWDGHWTQNNFTN